MEHPGTSEQTKPVAAEPAAPFELQPDPLSEAIGAEPMPERVTVPASVGKRVYLGIEMAVLFLVVPTLFWHSIIPLGVIPGIILFAAICLTLLLTDRTFDRRSLWRWGGLKKEWKRIVVQWLVFAPAMALGVWLFEPELLFSFPRHRTELWLAVMCLYPIFSVYGQELIYRVFFFHRYERLLTHGWMRVLGSAAVFGYVHIIFADNPWLSVILSGLGGVLFAWTYERSRSCAAAGFEHALYGDTVWTVGLGQFFYRGGL